MLRRYQIAYTSRFNLGMRRWVDKVYGPRKFWSKDKAIRFTKEKAFMALTDTKYEVVDMSTLKVVFTAQGSNGRD